MVSSFRIFRLETGGPDETQLLAVAHGCELWDDINVPIEHHPTIRYMVYNGYYKVMSNIPKMGRLPTPVNCEMI